MPAYIVGNITVTDPEAYKEYAAKAPETIYGHGGKYLVRGGAFEVLEGDWQPDRLVVLEFPDAETLKTWYYSDAYQAILPIRQKNSKGSIVFVDGFNPPQKLE
ncbi:DUF1330 domain-containing protein [Rhodospirillaceae bacterium KN72]|uniref:DUF1330 domain-containing protein n=1 Tax=Pacificispira spongiicola TaxID=2729598 RepID=A0A7Y0DZ74_9PROT|nr:DUF1330 domain-containing protein [Pacificispira spongiicola]NMM44312.1 DUF1330 domain-containing protein [Pacificispira spongiicola]